MSVYVDDMCDSSLGQFRRMKMSHMIADTEDELHEMARKIGVARKWYQGDHYDVCKSKRKLALDLGAVSITLRQCSAMCMLRRYTGTLPSPEDSIRAIAEYRRERNVRTEQSQEV